MFINKATTIHGNRYDYSEVNYKNNATNVKIVCKTHGEFNQTPQTHLRGSGCPECSRNMGAEVYKSRVTEIHKGRYTYPSLKFYGVDKPVSIECPIHGEFTTVAANHLYAKSGCPKCALTKKNTVDFVAQATKIHGDRYDYSLLNYVDSRLKVSIGCKIHGQFNISTNSHLKGRGCSKCSKTHLKTTAEFIRDAVKVHGGRYDYSLVEYVNSKHKISIGCYKHGVFMQSPLHHLSGKGCAICGGVQTKPTSDLLGQFKEVHGDRYNYSKVHYVSANNPVEIVCNIHGKFSQLTANHLKGSGCPKCASYSTSKEERELKEYFPEAVSTRKVLSNGKELDLYFEVHNVAVELNGNYWHSDKFKAKSYHIDKSNECFKLGIKLIHFSDADVRYRKPIVLSMITNALGRSTRVYARNTRVVKVEYAVAKQFFTRNHISGFAHHEVAYGLEVGGQLLTVMSFGKPRFDKEHEWEIIRLVTALNTTVVGGVSKLFKHFIDAHTPQSVMTYADIRYGRGEVYSKLGMGLVRQTEIGYSYFNDNGLEVSRYKAQKHKLQKLLGDKYNPKISETDNMKNAKFKKVYNCGNNLYSWKNHPKVV